MKQNIRYDNSLRYRDDWHPNQVALTPEYILEPVRASFGGCIDCDPCTEPDNPTKAATFYTVDGCESDWAGSVFCNPPYCKAKEKWVAKCIETARTGQPVILLIPAHTETRTWHAAVATASWICFLKGRVKFGIKRENGRQMAASHGSCLIGWNCDQTPFSVLGLVVVFNGQS